MVSMHEIEIKDKATPSMTVLTPGGWQQLISSINVKINVINMETTNVWNFQELCYYFVSKQKITIVRIFRFPKLYIFKYDEINQILCFTRDRLKKMASKK